MGKQVSDVDEASEESFLFFVNNQCVGFAVPETFPPQKKSSGIICLLCACFIDGVIRWEVLLTVISMGVRELNESSLDMLRLQEWKKLQR